MIREMASPSDFCGLILVLVFGTSLYKYKKLTFASITIYLCLQMFTYNIHDKPAEVNSLLKLEDFRDAYPQYTNFVSY